MTERQRFLNSVGTA